MFSRDGFGAFQNVGLVRNAAHKVPVVLRFGLTGQNHLFHDIREGTAGRIGSRVGNTRVDTVDEDGRTEIAPRTLVERIFDPVPVRVDNQRRDLRLHRCRRSEKNNHGARS